MTMRGTGCAKRLLLAAWDTDFRRPAVCRGVRPVRLRTPADTQPLAASAWPRTSRTVQTACAVSAGPGLANAPVAGDVGTGTVGNGNASTRVLFVAESVSLAQVVRLRVLSDQLDPRRYEVWFASARFDPLIFRGTRLRRHPIHSVSGRAVMRRISHGRWPYDTHTLAAYVREDMEMLERVQPALVVGDLRLSLAISAPKLRVPYAPLINAYWSPYCVRERLPCPSIPSSACSGTTGWHGISTRRCPSSSRTSPGR